MVRQIDSGLKVHTLHLQGRFWDEMFSTLYPGVLCL